MWTCGNQKKKEKEDIINGIITNECDGPQFIYKEDNN